MERIKEKRGILFLTVTTVTVTGQNQTFSLPRPSPSSVTALQCYSVTVRNPEAALHAQHLRYDLDQYVNSVPEKMVDKTVLRKIILVNPRFLRIFALAFESESCKQEKHCNIVLTLNIANF